MSTSDLPPYAPGDNSLFLSSSEEGDDGGGGNSEETDDASQKSSAASIDRFVDSGHETMEDDSPLALLE